MLFRSTIVALLVSLAACGDSLETTPSSSGQGAAQNTYDAMGEIIDIVGNEVTLKMIAMTENDQTETRVPGSGNGRKGGGSGLPVDREYTGEELTVIIPVGTLIVERVPSQDSGTTQSSGTGTGPVEQELGINQLTKGTILRIRYLDDGKTIEKILAIRP